MKKRRLGLCVSIFLFISFTVLALKLLAPIQVVALSQGVTNAWYPGFGIAEGDVSIAGYYATTQLPESYFDISTTGHGTVYVTLDYVCKAGQMGAQVYTYPQNSLILDLSNACHVSTSNPINSASFNVGGSADSNGLWNQQIVVRAVNGNGHFPFQIKVNGQQAPYISYAADQYPSSSTPWGNTWGTGDNEWGVFTGNMTFDFQPPCDWVPNSQPIYVKWNGADDGDASNPGPNQPLSLGMSFTITNHSTGWTKTVTGAAGLGDAAHDAYVYQSQIPASEVHPGDHITWSWNHVSGQNEIGLSVPFDSNSYDTGVKCGWHLSGDSHDGNKDILNQGQQVTFTHYVHHIDETYNNYYQDANYNWRVMWSNSPNGTYNPTSLTGAANNIAPGNNNPNPVSDNYTFPPWTPAGTQRCEIIKYTNADGPYTAAKYSSPICVRYYPSTTLVTACNNLTVFDPGSYGDYTITRTAVYVKDTNGNVLVHQTSPWDTSHSYIISDGSHHNFTYTPLSQGLTITIKYQYDSGGNTWHTYNTDVQTPVCYRATCSLGIGSSPGQVPGGASNQIIAGQQVSLTGNITNPGKWPGDPALQLPASINGHNRDLTYEVVAGGFTMTPPAFYKQDFSGGGNLGLGNTTGSQTWNITAPSSIGTYTVYGYADYWGNAPAGAVQGPFAPAYQPPVCSATFKTYQPFKLTPIYDASYDDVQDPTTVTYTTGVDTTPAAGASQNVTVQAPTDSCFYKQTASNNSCVFGGGSYVNGPPIVAPNQNYPPGTKTYTQGPNAVYTITGGVGSGDTYCAEIDLAYTAGWVGPGGPTDVAGTSAGGPYKACPSVKDRPYFKVFNGGVTAGGGFSNNGVCNGGYLAAWNNNSGTWPSGYNFGSSAQFSALALSNIVGFASNQDRSGTNNPIGLTFANNTGLSQDKYNPQLGGIYNHSSCFTDVTAPPSGIGSTAVSGPYSVPGGTITGSQSIFVNGNAYIGANIIYANSGTWASVSAIPSFVLHATGDIYIGPGVTQLDGIYISAKPGGHIYTCSNGFSPVAAPNIYNTCNKQLTVNGSFEADNVDLMRIFGSLRDEKPNGGTPSTPGTAGVTQPLVWSCGGSICNPNTSGMTCTPTIEPSEDPAHTWSDNKICVQGADSSIKLAWTYAGGTSPLAAVGSGFTNCTASWGSIVNSPPWNTPLGYTWSDNYLCSNVPITFTTASSVAGMQCTPIVEPSDSAGNNVWNGNTYVCIQSATPGNPGSPPGPPTPLNCSHNGGGISTSQTCAAETFEFSPELYLANPAVKQPDPPQIQAITSLPPVL